VGVLVFVGVAAGVTGLVHLYLWQRLVRDTLPPGRWRRVGGFAVLAAAVLVPATLLAGGLPMRYEVWIAWPGFLWLGIMFYLLVTLLALEVPVLAAGLGARLASRLARRRAPAPRPEPVAVPAGGGQGSAGSGPGGTDRAGRADPPGQAGISRRRVLRRGAAVTAGLVAAGAGSWGVTRAFAPPGITRLVVPLARLDPRADGLRVAVVADLHVGPLYGAAQVERVVEIVDGLDADLVAVVGDMVSSAPGEVRGSAAPLRRIRSRYGTFFVTGNHEYYTGHEEWIDAAEDLGMRVLRNERVEIAHRGGVIDLAGVNDREGSRYDDPPDYAAALGDRDPTRPVVLLAHQPVQVRQAARYGVDLQLSGHTHGGQVVPFDRLVRLDQPVVSGLAEVDGTPVYVTRGAGFWGPPMRVGADPEVALVELRAG
jgi:hypothetical protein